MQRQSAYASHRAGVEVIGGYKPVEGGKYSINPRKSLARLSDSLVLRDILWHFVNVFVGTFLGILPISLFLSGVWGVALMMGQHYFAPLFDVDPGGPHYMFLDMTTPQCVLVCRNHGYYPDPAGVHHRPTSAEGLRLLGSACAGRPPNWCCVSVSAT